MDDANVPSLLSIPLYAQYVLAENPAFDEIYQNTRRFVLSPDNPFFFAGRSCCGIGSVSRFATAPRFQLFSALLSNGLRILHNDRVLLGNVRNRGLDLQFYTASYHGFTEAHLAAEHSRAWFDHQLSGRNN
jgi:meiotically up-regulated gene 157 (Mug157) protein